MQYKVPNFLCSLYFFLLGGVRQKKPARVDTGMEHFSYLSETKLEFNL